MDDWQPLFDSLTQLKASWPGSPWSWDTRFAAVASTFAATDEPKARASAVHAFPRGWTTKSLETAPATLRALAERTGGLRAGQRLLAGDAARGGGLYGLWWPWGSGDKITLRLGLADVADTAEPVAQLRALFGAC